MGILDGKIALVTGAGSGIGRASAVGMAKEGAKIVVADIDPKGGEETVLAAKGRHDPCVLPRAVPMVEAMVALVLCDRLLADRAQCNIL